MNPSPHLFRQGVHHLYALVAFVDNSSWGKAPVTWARPRIRGRSTWLTVGTTRGHHYADRCLQLYRGGRHGRRGSAGTAGCRRDRRGQGRFRARRRAGAGRAPGRRRERRLRRLAALGGRAARRPPSRPEEVVAAADLVLLTVPDDALPDLVTGLAATGAACGASCSRTPAGGTALAVLDPATARRRAAAGAAPGDDVHRPRRRPAAGSPALLRRHRARGAAAGRRGPGHRDGRRAGLDRRGRPRRSTTRPWPAAPTTGHARRRVHGPAARGRRRATRAGCSARCSARRSTTRCGSAIAGLTGPVARGDAGTVARARRRTDRCAPEAGRAYVALARLTADRALAAGLLKPDAGRAPARTRWPATDWT